MNKFEELQEEINSLNRICGEQQRDLGNHFHCSCGITLYLKAKYCSHSSEENDKMFHCFECNKHYIKKYKQPLKELK